MKWSFLLAAFAVCISTAQADPDLIAQKIEELSEQADLAYEGFSEQNKSKGCFAVGMLYSTSKLLTEEFFGDMTNDQAQKAVFVQSSITFQISPFCMGRETDFTEAMKLSRKVQTKLSTLIN